MPHDNMYLNTTRYDMARKALTLKQVKSMCTRIMFNPSGPYYGRHKDCNVSNKKIDVHLLCSLPMPTNLTHDTRCICCCGIPTQSIHRMMELFKHSSCDYLANPLPVRCTGGSDQQYRNQTGGPLHGTVTQTRKV